MSLFVNLQTNSFRPNPSHSANETQAFRFGWKLLRGVKKIFSPPPEAALGSPADNSPPYVVGANNAFFYISVRHVSSCFALTYLYVKRRRSNTLSRIIVLMGH